MKKALTLISNDFKLIFRDKMLFVMLFMPFVLTILAKFLVPKYELLIPYHSAITIFVCLEYLAGFSFIIGFLFLEEKEENVAQALSVVPVDKNRIIFYRLGVYCVVVFFLTTFSIFILDLVSVNILYFMPLALMLSMQVGISSLLLANFASNKVEGMTYFKGFNMLFMLPLLMYFIAPIWHLLFVVSPTFWLIKAFEASLISDVSYWIFMGIGLIFHVILFSLLWRRFSKVSF